jgi:hypothetical protein
MRRKWFFFVQGFLAGWILAIFLGLGRKGDEELGILMGKSGLEGYWNVWKG